VIDHGTPRFSWQLLHAQRAQSQSAYRLRLALDPNFEQILWDTQQVTSTQSLLIPYSGAEQLQSDTTYWWQVQWWDASGVAAPVSDAAFFDVALLSESDWANAQYIAPPANSSLSLLRAEFPLQNGAVIRARAYVVGLGWHFCSLNGQSCAPDIVLAPGWTQVCLQPHFCCVITHHQLNKCMCGWVVRSAHALYVI
jgi:alpha-L-rhamnosidase